MHTHAHTRMHTPIHSSCKSLNTASPELLLSTTVVPMHWACKCGERGQCVGPEKQKPGPALRELSLQGRGQSDNRGVGAKRTGLLQRALVSKPWRRELGWQDWMTQVGLKGPVEILQRQKS